jgi:flagellar basal-body rod protein FlgB
MDLDKLPLFALMKRKMDWLTQRQQVLADNVANADTNGYVARDIEAFSFKDALRQSSALTTSVTNLHHIPVQSQASDSRVGKDRASYDISPTGNSVVLEQQMMKVSETAADYQLALNLYRKQVSLIKTAIGRSGGG